MSIKDYQDRLLNKRWGVFNHFIFVIQNNPSIINSYGKQTSWDELVNGFDTELVAKQLHDVGAGYYVITVMQGTKYMIAPNSAFNAISSAVEGEACSKRDLINDLYKSLSKYDIDLYLYFTGDGPYKNEEIGKKFGFVEPREKGVTTEFVLKWSSVLREYSLRYKDKVKGWWIDGCYKEWFGYTDELLKIYYDACKAGNPNSLVALNNGVSSKGIENGASYEDFTCGECVSFDVIPEKRFYGSAQSHVLASLGTGDNGIGPSWGSFGCQIDGDKLADYVAKVNQAGGVVTIDIGVYRDGKFDEEQMSVLKAINEKRRY